MTSLTSAGNTCERFATNARLGTVTHIEAISSGILPRATDKDTLEVERECGLGNAKYFYAQRLHERFGSIGLVYLPELESGRAGSANPFDTGGVYRGKTAPFNRMSPKERCKEAHRLIRATRQDLDRWRTAFAAYLKDFFPEPEDYLVEKPQPMKPTSGVLYPSTLPVLHEVNVDEDDFRFCTWEVRIEDDIPVVEALAAWGCTEVDLEELHDWILDDPDHPLATLADLQPSVIDDASVVCRVLERGLI